MVFDGVWHGKIVGRPDDADAMPADYGLRLSDAEYERRIVELHSKLSPAQRLEEDADVRRRELELAIDHRLGRDFPRDRREALWAVQQRVEKKRLRLAIQYLWRRFFTKLLLRDAGSMAAYAAEEYSKVLSNDDLRRFLELGEHGQPALPVDATHLKK